VISGIALFYSCSSSGSSQITTEDPNEAFNIAKRMYDKGDFVSAIEAFSFIKIKFPGTQIADQIQFYLAQSYFERKEYLLGAYEYENMLKNYPLSNLIPESRYKLGLSYYYLSPKSGLDQEFTHYAMSELQLFAELYPNDKNAADASAKLQELKDKLAYKDLTIGQQYVILEDYSAAVLYFKNVYDNFIDSKYTDEAMVDQADALIHLKKIDDAKKVLDRFYKLFPNSKFKSRADELYNMTLAGK
jgi:outer membrane protein assembly factor BamD